MVLAQVERFLAAAAMDPAAEGGSLTIVQAAGEPAATLGEPAATVGDANAGAGAIVAAARARFGAGAAVERGGGLARHRWDWHGPPQPFDGAALVDFYRAHEALPAIGERRQVDVMLSYWFDLRRPGTTERLFPGSTLRSSAMIWLGARHVNLSVRYDAPGFTPELRTIHDALIATLGPKPPRHALQLIVPATTPRGRERRVPLT